MTTRKRKSGVERKSEIVDTAIGIASELGPDRLTMQHLADKIGISQPAIFRHFPTKSDVWQSVAERIAQLLQGAAKGAGRAGQSPAQQLKSQVAAQLGFIQNNPAIPAILFSRELHAENESLRRFFAGLMAGRHRTLSGLIQQEITRGGFRADLDPDDAAYLILTLIQGLAMRWSLSARSFDLQLEGTRLLELQLTAFQNFSPKHPPGMRH
ncbi:MAG: TetR/AcrR family transcriptional regulator [Paracoccaceae bacterium]